MRRFALTSILFIAANFFPVTRSNAQVTRLGPNDARAAAAQWKDLVDGGVWDRAWDSTSAAFKSMVAREYWRGLMAGRGVYGLVMATKLQSARTLQLPGFPDGQYWVFRYQVDFQDGTRGTDMVAVRMEAGNWRIASYDFVPSPNSRVALLQPLSER